MQGDIPDAAHVGCGMEYRWREPGVSQAAVMWEHSPISWVLNVQANVLLSISKDCIHSCVCVVISLVIACRK